MDFRHTSDSVYISRDAGFLYILCYVKCSKELFNSHTKHSNEPVQCYQTNVVGSHKILGVTEHIDSMSTCEVLLLHYLKLANLGLLPGWLDRKPHGVLVVGSLFQY